MNRFSILDRSIATRLSRKLRNPALGAAALALASGSAHAVTQIWDGSTSNQISLNTNYVSNVAPVDGDTIQWNGVQAGNLALTNNLSVANGVGLELTSLQTGSVTIDTTVSAVPVGA